MPLQKTEAVILRSIKQGESSKILTLYSRAFGKITAIAKGARNMKSRFGGTLELLNYVSIVFYEKENRELQFLSQAEIIDSFPQIKQDLQKTSLAMAVCELINQLEVGREPNPILFRLLLSTLKSINHACDNPMNIFRAFQIHIFDIMGFRPNFYECMGCGKRMDGAALFDLREGGLVCKKCREEGNATVVLYQEALNTLRRLQKVHLSSINGLLLTSTSEQQTDDFLQAYLHYHVEGLRDLKALKFLKKI